MDNNTTYSVMGTYKNKYSIMAPMSYVDKERAIRFAYEMFLSNDVVEVQVTENRVVWRDAKITPPFREPTKCNACGATENLYATNCRATPDYIHLLEFQGV